MKNLIIFPALILALASGIRADDGCDKASDACKPQIKKVTPFMAELKKAEIKIEPKRSGGDGASLQQGQSKTAALRQGAPKAQLIPAAPAVEPAVSAAPPENKKILSNPAWLLAAAALLAGLYYFLKESKKKK
jgi:hypothetical protein